MDHQPHLQVLLNPPVEMQPSVVAAQVGLASAARTRTSAAAHMYTADKCSPTVDVFAAAGRGRQARGVAAR